MPETVKEKLVALQLQADIADNVSVNATQHREFTADFMMANGVTVQEWIPVTDRLPELIPCSAGTAYSEAVNVLTTGRKVITAIWDGTDFIGDAEFWNAENEEITHWTPVLLPLPESPDGT